MELNDEIVYRALYKFEARFADELSFSPGAVITEIQRHESGMWKGRYNGKVGLFPYNYVAEMDSTEKPVNSSPHVPPQQKLEREVAYHLSEEGIITKITPLSMTFLASFMSSLLSQPSVQNFSSTTIFYALKAFDIACARSIIIREYSLKDVLKEIDPVESDSQLCKEGNVEKKIEKNRKLDFKQSSDQFVPSNDIPFATVATKQQFNQVKALIHNQGMKPQAFKNHRDTKEEEEEGEDDCDENGIKDDEMEEEKEDNMIDVKKTIEKQFHETLPSLTHNCTCLCPPLPSVSATVQKIEKGEEMNDRILCWEHMSELICNLTQHLNPYFSIFVLTYQSQIEDSKAANDSTGSSSLLAPSSPSENDCLSSVESPLPSLLSLVLYFLRQDAVTKQDVSLASRTNAMSTLNLLTTIETGRNVNCFVAGGGFRELLLYLNSTNESCTSIKSEAMWILQNIISKIKARMDNYLNFQKKNYIFNVEEEFDNLEVYYDGLTEDLGYDIIKVNHEILSLVPELKNEQRIREEAKKKNIPTAFVVQKEMSENCEEIGFQDYLLSMVYYPLSFENEAVDVKNVIEFFRITTL
eukprot:MONOS_10043.1-p1 / transcript=MONOS_10043.1 / gene=MONOS_10043 / organism=Monocercomonoides_exilis_PA203 / gene_product=unspecified product / transcript_product=unspecified product / location=Mono_scaffold00439:47283-49770(+) / protein_length=581 / sequence_SO=supercontig / SO=protein_coding / is_pseudo=false